MSLDTVGLLGALRDHATGLGLFEQVLLHEPENAPSTGLTCSLLAGPGDPIPQLSGMIKTSWRVEVVARLYIDLLHEPQDDTETLLMSAVDALVASYSSGFTLGGLVQSVDLLGAYGAALSWKPAYATHNHKLYRIATITLPLIVIDVYDQAA